MKNKLINFIKGTDRELVVSSIDTKYIMSVHRVTDNLHYVYSTAIYKRRDDKDVTLRMTDNFEFACVFNSLDDEIYFANWDLKRVLCDEYDENTYGKAEVSERFRGEVERRISEIVANDLSNLDGYEDKSNVYRFDERMEAIVADREIGDARRLFMKGTKPNDVVFGVSVTDDTNIKDTLVFIERGDDFVEEFAREYISLHKKQIQLQLLRNKILREDLQSLYDDVNNVVHIRKAIKDAVKNEGCKTVNVTTVIDGKELTFKTEAPTLTTEEGDYSTYSIVAKDREKFSKVYGRGANYTPEDIVKLVFGRKTLYSKEK